MLENLSQKVIKSIPSIPATTKLLVFPPIAVMTIKSGWISHVSVNYTSAVIKTLPSLYVCMVFATIKCLIKKKNQTNPVNPILCLQVLPQCVFLFSKCSARHLVLRAARNGRQDQGKS